ncbi:pseudouridine synthase rsua/rlub/c/d/e/f [Trichococcus palustris]|jgi:23S rRNA pseudouridine1911/1915/1917 synthase|uniref:Pseudouridine synthase n=1 Tax=Trichococcus palustris TaxID=140314 RepID=A0A143YBI2_9LACT|nr:pseudouridine synthase rsua/rlub/c/d/e/f [Trichococcus palustris]SFK56906.1 23S rRNA pseudouridine1911/1915/1917 synthase [Trichococcus palustris]
MIDELEFKIDLQSGRIDKILADFMPKTSRSQIQAWIKGGNLSVNGEVVKANYKVQLGDTLKLTIPEAEKINVTPENIPLDIVFEDDDLLVVNKPTGMVVHPSKGHLTGTLVNGLLYHVNTLSEGTAYVRPGIVHRIDMDTSGLLVVAKTNEAHQKLAEQLENHTMEREYYALVHGVISHEDGTIDAPIARMHIDRKKRTVAEGGKHAITHFEVVERFKNYTLVKLNLETGRTHQIRVHMKYIGHPVVGDPMYGPSETITGFGQFLHAATLGFVHPTTKETMHFEAPLPDYFADKLAELRKI